jgi:hypothetical protein
MNDTVNSPWLGGSNEAEGVERDDEREAKVQ